MPDLKEGQQVGPWKLLEFRGEGGNAEVWRCRREANVEAAVKFLKTRKTENVRWERFRREVDYVSSLGNRPGVLPILDYELPQAPPPNSRAWYSMPEASELAAALSEATLREVVEAIVPIARTLAELAERDGTAHRDLKPGNLYLWDGSPAVGDFGLLWRPELAQITGSEIPGAFSYTAPELFREDLDDDAIDYFRADVFSLAKTLWALARGQKFAIPGPHDPTDLNATIALYRPAPSSRALDLVITRATEAVPEKRPTMAGFAEELEGWLTLATPGAGVPDLTAITAQIREQLEPAVAEESSREELIGFARGAVARTREELGALFDHLGANVPGARTNVRSVDIEGLMRTYETMQGPEALWRESICASLSDKAEPLAFVLTFGVMVEILDSGVLRVGAAFVLGHEKVMQHADDQSGVREVAAGSVEQEAAVRAATDWLKENIESWLERFFEGSVAS